MYDESKMTLSTGKKLAIDRIYFGNVLDVNWKAGAEFFKKYCALSYSYLSARYAG